MTFACIVIVRYMILAVFIRRGGIVTCRGVSGADPSCDAKNTIPALGTTPELTASRVRLARLGLSVHSLSEASDEVMKM